MVTIMPVPTMADLQRAVLEFAGYANVDRSWAVLAEVTGSVADPALPEHRQALFTWLNAWGCRLRYPRPGEPDVFDTELAAWWAGHAAHLPGAGESLIDLGDAQVAALGDCFAGLAAMPAVGGPRGRALGPTAASKLLYALRPKTLMPWDEAIATRLHGARDARSYVAHQTLGRSWGRALLAEAGLAGTGSGESGLVERLGRPGTGLAKLLDEYCYLEFSRAK